MSGGVRYSRASIVAHGALLGCALGWATNVLAQSDEPRQATLEEVVVTAQKREESLQDTPISVATFNASELMTKGIYNLQDLQSNVPNLQFAPFPNAASTPRIFLRGVGSNDDQVTQDHKIAIYLDGVYMARSQGLSTDVANIERIEVLRGPQGTLYGRNATGGAINFITEKPNLEELNFEQQVTLGRRDLLRTKTSLNVPLGNEFAVRLSYLNVEQDGFVENAGTGSDYFGSKDRQAYMLDMAWNPLDNLDIRYTYDRSDIEDSPAFIALTPGGFETGRRPDESSPFIDDLRDNDITAKGHTLTATWALHPSLTVKSITAYRELSQDVSQDYLTGFFGPIPFLKIGVEGDQDQFSQEIQLLGDAFDQRLEYIVGLYYFEEDGDKFERQLVPIANSEVHREVTFDNRAYALFGQGTWTPPILSDRLHVTLGARWSHDEREATLKQWAGPLGGPVTALPQVGDGDNDFNDFSPSMVVAYDVMEQLNLYAKVVKGYKTGGFNVRSSSIQRFNQGFDEETLISYEAGAKSQWFNNRLRVNLAFFNADYKDIQIQVASDPNNPTLTDVLNAGEATIEGAELDVTALLVEGLTLNLSYGYVDPDYDKIEDATGQDITHQFRFIHTPAHSYTVDVNYEFPRTPLGLLSANVNYTWQDEKFASAIRPIGIEDYALLNARVRLSEVPLPAGDLEIAVWGRNLEDKEYQLAHLNLGPAVGAFYGEPRTYGVDFIYRY